MEATTRQSRAIWALVRRQHGVIARRQLLAAGFSAKAIRHRLATGRLHRTPFRGVYAVGRPELSELGRWMATVLSCGEGAFLSHRDAAALWGILRPARGPVHVTVTTSARSRPGICVHRRTGMQLSETTTTNGIPVTTPLATLIDLAATAISDRRLEAAINEADKLGLLRADRIPSLVDVVRPRAGTKRLRAAATRHQPTDSDLERTLLRHIRRARLPMPETQVLLDGMRVDFYWPDLGLVVETDGARYHRTPAQQAEDRRRDQRHAAEGRTVVRFAAVHVGASAIATLRAVIARLQPL